MENSTELCNPSFIDREGKKTRFPPSLTGHRMSLKPSADHISPNPLVFSSAYLFLISGIDALLHLS